MTDEELQKTADDLAELTTKATELALEARAIPCKEAQLLSKCTITWILLNAGAHCGQFTQSDSIALFDTFYQVINQFGKLVISKEVTK